MGAKTPEDGANGKGYVSDGVHESVKKSTVVHEKIKIAANDPSLRGKIHVDQIAPGDKVLWYIRFNLPLDQSTVNKNTMSVMETNGYILTSVFNYDEIGNTIIIAPVDPYLDNEFYILSISTKVKSAKGTPLKNPIHILFKLFQNRITEFRILEKTAKVPKPRVKPESEKMKTALAVSKYYSFMDKPSAWNFAQLPIMDMKVNMLLGFVGIIAFFATLFVHNAVFDYAAYALCLAGILHIGAQASKKGARSAFAYNFGAMLFNMSRVKSSVKHFEKAHRLDESNEYAEYALNKVKFYD